MVTAWRARLCGGALGLAIAGAGAGAVGSAGAETPPPGAAHAGSAGQACAHCHADVHAGTTKRACADCHAPERWVPSTFTVADHAALAFALTGKHAAVGCEQCHAKHALGGLPNACADCHVDRHRGRFGEDCTACHTVEGFAPVPGFDHARTGFVVAGAHGTLACADCHEGERGRTLLHAAQVGCATCHEAGHGDLGEDCSTCHRSDDTTFAQARPRFDHRTTGFALERRHAVQNCAACHAVAGGAPQPRCDSCHVDPHSAQLGTICEDCHAPDRWRLARFDHDATGWVLRGAHFTASCGECHQSQRWVGTPTECWDCHAKDAMRAPQTVDAHRFGRSTCGDCHGTWTFSM